MNTGNNNENTVEVRAESIDPPSWLSATSEFALGVLQHLGVSRSEVSVLFCSSEFIRQLNREYRRIDDVTDILSFVDDSSFASGCAGDIVIAPEVVETQSREFGVPYEEELRRVITHGLLHLYGYEHSSNDFSREPMLILQENIVRELKEKLF